MRIGALADLKRALDLHGVSTVPRKRFFLGHHVPSTPAALGDRVGDDPEPEAELIVGH